jgi:hypothetical protein
VTEKGPGTGVGVGVGSGVEQAVATNNIDIKITTSFLRIHTHLYFVFSGERPGFFAGFWVP